MRRPRRMTTARSRRRAPACVAALALALLVALPEPAAARIWETTFRGQWSCNDRGRYLPMAGVRVELWRRYAKWSPRALDTKVGQTWTDADGAYSIHTRTSASDSHDFYPVVPLDGLTEFPFSGFEYTTRFQVDDVPERDFGVAIVSDTRCAVWLGFLRALRDYRAATGSAGSGGFGGVLYGAPTAGVPFALYDVVWWPSGHAPSMTLAGDGFGYDTARHEFAHTVRHTLDGSLTHWLGDVAAYNYAQQHSLCTRASSAFAFNEGWANYWAGVGNRYRTGPGEVRAACNPATDMRYEGNVAAALQALQERCGLTRGAMVAVLARNRGRIHGFDAFRAATPCPSPLLAPALALATKVSHGVSIAKMLRIGRARVRAIDRAIVGTRRELAGAPRTARGLCPKRPCAPVQLRQVLLRGDLDQLALLRRTVSFATSRSRLARIWRQPPARHAATLRSLRRAYERSSAAIARRTIARALATARRVRAGSQAIRALGALRRGIARGALPAGLLSRIATPVARRGGPTPVPAPPPPPAPPPAPPPPPPPPPAPPPAPKADLVVDRLWLTSDTGWLWNATVRNAGAAAAPATKTAIAQQDLADVLVDTPALAAGASVTVTVSCPYGSLSTGTARADATALVDESDETNNSRASEPGGVGGRCRYP